MLHGAKKVVVAAPSSTEWLYERPEFGGTKIPQRVQISRNQGLGIWARAVLEVLGKYVTTSFADPRGIRILNSSR